MAVLTGDSKVHFVDVATMKVLHSIDVCANPLGALRAAAQAPATRHFVALPQRC